MRTLWWGIVLVGGLANAGCLSNEAADPTGVPVGATGPPTTAGPGEPLLDWAAAWDGSLALRLVLEPQAPTRCVFRTSYTPTATVEGWDFVLLELRSQSSNWIIMGSRWHGAQVHATPQIDSRDILPPSVDAQTQTLEWELAGVAEPVVLVLGARGLSTDRLEAGHNVAAGLRCDGAARIVGIEAGRDLAIWDGSTTASGTGADGGTPIGIDGGASVGDGTSLSTDAPTSFLFIQESYEQAGQLEVVYPGGQQTFVLEPHFDDEPPTHTIESGPGDLRVTFTEARFFGGGHWGLVAGFYPVPGLDALETILGNAGHGCAHGETCGTP